MAKQNQNLFSPFLVNYASEGAEKALHMKVIAALFPKSVFSILL